MEISGINMNIEVINSIYQYIEVLFENNQRLIKLFGITALRAITNESKDILNLFQDIPRLIPYSYCEKEDKLYLDDKDGLLQYKKEIPNLKKNYEKIIEQNEKSLKKIKRIRNKYEHTLHNVRMQSCLKSNNTWFEYSFVIKSKEYHVDSKELTKLFHDLNILYDDLIKSILEYVYKNNLNNMYGQLKRIDLVGFNKIYNSDLLCEVGMAIAGI